MVMIPIMKCQICGTVFPYVGKGNVVVHCAKPGKDILQNIGTGCKKIGEVDIPDSHIMKMFGKEKGDEDEGEKTD